MMFVVTSPFWNEVEKVSPASYSCGQQQMHWTEVGHESVAALFCVPFVVGSGSTVASPWGAVDRRMFCNSDSAATAGRRSIVNVRSIVGVSLIEARMRLVESIFLERRLTSPTRNPK
jgi:hypothetical protein